jgi:hypothetical protein
MTYAVILKGMVVRGILHKRYLQIAQFEKTIEQQVLASFGKESLIQGLCAINKELKLASESN